MPRKPRDEEPGATYHVYIHSVDEGRIVWDDFDRRALLKMVATAVQRKGWICLAACVMDTHYHLLVITPEPNLARGMQLLNGCYAQQVNRRHDRKGHLFRTRYEAKRVVTDAYLLVLVQYIALNPVEAGITDDPRSYKWSSYPGVVGATGCWPFIARNELLAHFGSREHSVDSLKDFVESRTREQAA